MEGAVISIVNEVDEGGTTEILSVETSVLSTDIDPRIGRQLVSNSALFRLQSESLSGAFLAQEHDGVVALVAALALTESWQEHLEKWEAFLATPIPLVPNAIRQALEVNAGFSGAPTAVQMTNGSDARNEAVGEQTSEFQSIFHTNEEIAFKVRFEDASVLEHRLNLEIFTPWDQEESWFSYAIDFANQPEVDGRDFSVFYADDGAVEVSFYMRPDPTPFFAGENYIAKLHYRGITIAHLSFSLRNPEPQPATVSETTPQISLMLEGDDPNAPLYGVAMVNNTEFVRIRGTMDIPANSQLRLRVAQDGIWIPDRIETLRYAENLTENADYFYFFPDLTGLEGNYELTITLNGRTVWTKEIVVFSPAPPITIESDDATFFEQVLLSPNNEPRTVPDEVDLGLFITSSPDWAIHSTEAWLRGQGWRRTFGLQYEVYGHRTQRWLKDGYALVMEVANTTEDGSEIWYRLDAITADAPSPPPADIPLSAATVFDAVEVGEFVISNANIVDVAMSPDGYWIAIATDIGQVVFLNGETLDPVQWFTYNDAVAANLTFSADSSRLALSIGADDLWQVQTWEYDGGIWTRTGNFIGHHAPLTDIVFIDKGGEDIDPGESGRIILTASQDGSVRTWWHETYLDTVWHYEEGVTDLVRLSEEELLLVALSTGAVQVYEHDATSDPVDALKALYALSTERVESSLTLSSVRLDDGSSQVLIYNGDATPGEIEAWQFNVEKGERFAALPFEQPSFALASSGVTIDPTGSLLVTAENVAHFFNLDSGEYIGEWVAEDGYAENAAVAIKHIEYSPDGRFLLVLADDGHLHLWAVAAGSDSDRTSLEEEKSTAVASASSPPSSEPDRKSADTARIMPEGDDISEDTSDISALGRIRPEWLYFVPLGAHEILITNWAQWQATNSDTPFFERDETLSVQETFEEMRKSPLYPHLYTKAMRTLADDFRTHWGWDATDLLWELSVPPINGASYQVLKFHPNTDWTVMLTLLEQYDFAVETVDGAISYSTELGQLPRNSETLEIDDVVFQGYSREMLNLLLLPDEKILYVGGIFPRYESMAHDYLTRNTIGYVTPLDELEVEELMAELGIDRSNESEVNGEANGELDVEQEEELMEAILNRLYASAAISMAATLDDSISTGLWLDFGICNTLASSPIHDLMLRDVGSGTASDTEKLKEELETLMAQIKETVTSNIYMGLGTGVTLQDGEAISTLVMHYPEATLAQADLDVRRRVAESDFVIDDEMMPYSERFQVLDATVEGENLLMQLAWLGSEHSVAAMFYGTDMLFAACP